MPQPNIERMLTRLRKLEAPEDFEHWKKGVANVYSPGETSGWSAASVWHRRVPGVIKREYYASLAKAYEWQADLHVKKQRHESAARAFHAAAVNFRKAGPLKLKEQLGSWSNFARHLERVPARYGTDNFTPLHQLADGIRSVAHAGREDYHVGQLLQTLVGMHQRHAELLFQGVRPNFSFLRSHVAVYRDAGHADAERHAWTDLVSYVEASAPYLHSFWCSNLLKDLDSSRLPRNVKNPLRRRLSNLTR